MSFLRSFFLLLAFLAAPLAAQEPEDFARGVEAYRRGDYAEARARWQATLALPLAPAERARVYHDLGNAHWRLGAELVALACWQAALELDGRHADARANLELARAKKGLGPADPGGIEGVLARARTLLAPDQQRDLLFAALVLWVLALLAELRAGGTLGRAGLALASALLVLAALPWAAARLAPREVAPMLVIAGGPAPLRAEPLDVREPIGELAQLERVERIDELSGWTRVERQDGTRGWVRSENLFALVLGNDGSGG
jgi:tetratricopeptide (TPR) repeat protein